MTNEQKAQVYNQLMSEHIRLSNQISSIKGENIDLNQDQIQRIKIVESKIQEIVIRLSRL
jgi:hypothetical protein